MLISAIVALGISVCSYGDNAGWHFVPSQRDTNAQFHKRLPLPFADDITPAQDVDKIVLTATQKHQARVWGLSDSEEKRYIALLQNRSGVFYAEKHLTPVQLLGMNARTDMERQRYAKQDVAQQFRQNAKYFAYLAAYQQAATALKKHLQLPVIRDFNKTPFSPYAYQPVGLVAHDKLMLFVRLDDAVHPIVASLMASIAKIANLQLNIYFIGNPPQTAIVAWAKTQNIPPALVQQGKITLNPDNGKYQALQTQRPLPLLLRLRAGKSRFVDTGRF